MSLRNKLILIILIPIAVLSILHVLGLQRVITGYEASLIANQDSLARSATRAIKNQMEKMIRITVTLSRPGEIIHAVEAADNNVLYDWSKSFVGAVDCIQFADIAGIVLSRAPDEFRFGDNVGDSKYFTAALEEDVFFDICVMEGKTALVASRTVRKYDDMPVGVVTVASYMTPNLLRTLIGPEGDVLQYTGEKVVTSSAINSSVQRTVPLSLDELGQGFAGAFTVVFEEEEEYKRLLSLEKFGYASGLSAALAAVLALLLVLRSLLGPYTVIVQNVLAYAQGQHNLEALRDNLVAVGRNSTREVARITSALGSMVDTLDDYFGKLTQLAVEMEEMAHTDSLTGLRNRKHMDEALAAETERVKRYGGHYAVVLLDIDHFKDINDTHGHQIGDLVLINLGHVLRENCRATDQVGRWGGEEFLILCPGIGWRDAAILAEKIRSILENERFHKQVCVTASLGVAEFQPGEAIHDLVARVDKALYQAKLAGRNTVRSSLDA